MAYLLMTPYNFKKDLDNYLIEKPLDLSYEKTLLDNFSSNNLSDLYKLFLDLKDSKLNKKLYNELKNILSNTFSINPNQIFTLDDDENDIVCISKDIHIPLLLEIIKNKYLDYIKTSSTIDSEELFKLSLIVNKNFPELFLQLIESPNQDIGQAQNFVKEKILETIDEWHSNTSKDADEENRDIAGAFYITARKLYPDLSIYIPGRVKSMKSSLSNIEKETKDSLLSLHPSNYEIGLTNEDIEKQFNLDSATTDFSALTIVLANTDDTLHFDKSDPESLEILKLRKNRQDNINFTHSLENFLSKNEATNLSCIQLLQIKIELLQRLREASYEECTQEYHGTSFSELLKKDIEKYNQEFENPNDENLNIDDLKYMKEMDEIYELLDELKKRVHDKYQAKLLEIAIPEILEDKIFSKELKVKSYFVKKVRKKNGFCSDYYCIETSDGRKIELQAQSKKRFEDSKNGPSDHSLLPNKEIDISRFFEPLNSNFGEGNFEYFLDFLNNMPIATKNYLLNTPDTDLSPFDKRTKRKLKIAIENVKLKDNINITLPIFAEYVSPKLMTVSSHHTRVNTSVAGYNKKSLVSGFTEVLLKHDSTTCLSQMLIDKLETLVPSDKNQVSKNGIGKRAKARFNKKSNSIDER